MIPTRWIVLIIIILASSISYVLRTNISIVGETMMNDLGMTEYQLGLIFSAFAFGYALFQFPGGLLSDRFGPRFAMTLTAILWAVLTVVTAFIPGTDVLSVSAIVAALIVTRFLVGAVHAPIFPVTCGGSIAAWFPVREWGLPMGLSSTGLTLGAAVTAPVLVWIMESYGWRIALLATAPSALIVAALYYWYVCDDPADHPRMTAEELAVIKSDRPPEKPAGEKGAWKQVLKNRNILLISASYFCSNYVFFLFFNWFFFYLVSVKNFSATDAGMLTAALWVIGAIGATAGGFICDFLVNRLGVRRGTQYMTVTALIASAIFLYTGATSDQAMFTVVMLCVSFGCNQLTEAPMWVSTMTVAGRHSATASGVLNTGGNIPGIIGGVLVPLTASWWGWPAAMNVGAALAIVAALLWFFIRADEIMESAPNSA